MAFRAGALSIALAAVYLMGEIGLRVLDVVRDRRTDTVVHEITLDRRLGWRATENYRFSGSLVDADGVSYAADVRTDENGFRVFGDPHRSDRPRLLVLGDSFTQAIQVSGERAYYSLLGSDIGAEVFAYGAGGFGTLQELMVLGDLLDHVRPDGLLLQLCTNDFINNHFRLELRSRYNNNGLLRPYREHNGEIAYRVPKRPMALRKIAARHSRFLYFLFSRVDRIMANTEGGSVEDVIARVGESDADYAEAVETTGRLLEEIGRAIGADTPLFAFCVDLAEPSYADLRRLSRQAGFVFIDGVPQIIIEAERAGECTRAADGGHWNERGHRLAASVLGDGLRQHWRVSRSPMDPGSTNRGARNALKPPH
jgi:hypothetical protein